jgi:RHS repeat-associated protein
MPCDNADRRTNEIWSTGRNLGYGYDRAHQLLSAVSTGRASDVASYAYDKAGNPTSRKELGITSAYAFNNLNQFTSGSWTGALTVIGEMNYAAGTVTVNSVTAKLFPDRVFEATNITVSAGTNTLTAVYHGPAFTNSQTVATNTSTVIMATPVFGYDAKGNLTNDSDFAYQYDIANRLTNAISKTTGSSVLAARYDGLGRRIEVTRNGATVERYVYLPGSFLVLAVLDGSNTVKEIYTHGPDLSGSVGGAGGIGGILSGTTNISQTIARKYFHADVMGNVVLVSDTDGKQAAAYGYTPFGKLVSQVGDFKARFFFSNKELDSETGLLLFGLRYLAPARGAWLSRDPSGEAGGINLFGFAGNNALSHFDPLGLEFKETVQYNYSPAEGIMHEGSAVAGLSTFNMKLSSTCKQCKDNDRTCYRIHLEQFLVSADTTIYPNYWSVQGDKRVLRGLPVANIQHSWNHEQHMRQMMRTWHDENRSKIETDLNTACGAFVSKTSCDRERRVRESKWLGQWLHQMNTVRKWDFQNRGQGPVVSQPLDPHAIGSFQDNQPPSHDN